MAGGTWSDWYVSHRFADVTEHQNQAGHANDFIADDAEPLPGEGRNCRIVVRRQKRWTEPH